jgi:uncharacterized membrane protein YfcA
MDTITLVSVGVVLFFGSLIQRVTGMGLALVAAPFLVLILGTVIGVQTLLVVGLGVCLASAITLRADVNIRRAILLLATSVVGLIPGTLIARALPASWLGILIGTVTLAALASIVFLRKSSLFVGARGTGIAGALSGFMNVTAGVGGPPIVIYANSINWNYREYLATVQLYFAGLNVLSLFARGVPELPASGWAVAAISAVAGIIIGNRLSKTINESIAKKAVFAIAFIGSLATVIQGISTL